MVPLKDAHEPYDVAVSADSNQCYASTVSLGAPLTGDNCGVASVTNDAPATFGRDRELHALRKENHE